VREVEQALPLYGEFLKFTFEREAEEGAGETTVVSDMLTDIERMTVKEDFKKAGEDTKRIQELAKRSQELRK